MKKEFPNQNSECPPQFKGVCITTEDIAKNYARIDAAEQSNSPKSITKPRFWLFSQGELDSLNTALGNSTRKLFTLMSEAQQADVLCPNLIGYYYLCIDDNERLIAEINEEIKRRRP